MGYRLKDGTILTVDKYITRIESFIKFIIINLMTLRMRNTSKISLLRVSLFSTPDMAVAGGGCDY